ncbi:right-handed parallel beta-helix repeat-containing protein [Methanobrevibacter smithii]|uniref:right-handed parallel beta-helix repeat-containing protein n=2 Tax=Methanobrevibacter smithii TaxID=2173 RepID=UPI002431F7DD|nr:Ig-like domain repeat protein [Methanobrevibacter smithii]HJJ02638.1 right-handed parallel beta-helix repeat-containing protein [Methanobrevibacter smithii]
MNFKYLIFLCLMFIVSMGAVSAADDVNSTFNANIDVNDVPVDSVIIDNPIYTNNAKEYTITNDNYGNYFDNETGDALEEAPFNNGDILKIDNVSDKYFVINKNLTIMPAGDNITLKNVGFNFVPGSEGSVVDGITIENNAQKWVNNNQIQLIPILIQYSKNVTVVNSYIHSSANHAFALANSSYCNIKNNTLSTITSVSGGWGGKTTFLISLSRYNNITDNKMYSTSANVIQFLFGFPGVKVGKGISEFNLIKNNYLNGTTGMNFAMCYGIRIMGNNAVGKPTGQNTFAGNVISNAFVGIQAQGDVKEVIAINNTFINVKTGIDVYSNVADGGIVVKGNSINASNIGILLKKGYAIIENNTINADSYGIQFTSADSKNSIVDNNVIISGKDYAISVAGTNTSITDNYIISKDYYGNGAVTSKSNDTIIENNTPAGASINTDISASINKNATIKIDVLPFDANGNVTIKFNGKSETVSFNASQTIVYDLGVLGIGDYEVTVIYNGNAKYNATNITKTFSIGKISDYNVTLNTTDVVAGENSTLVIILPEDATGVVNVTVGKDSYKANVTDGVASVKINSLIAGDYKVNVTYSGDKTYEVSNNVFNLAVNPMKVNLNISDVVMFYRDGTRMVAILTDIKGNPIANATVYFTINGKTYARTTDTNGTASLAINLISKIYNSTILYNGSDIYDKFSKNITVTVNPTILANDTVLMYMDGTVFVAKFLDKTGKALTNASVKFNINGVFYTRITDNDGVAKLNIRLRPGSYILTAYNNVTGEEKGFDITVKSLIVANDLTKYYLNATRFEATIYNKNGTLAINKNVTFNINGVFYTRQTNENGVVGLNINLRPGNYIITTMFDGLAIGNNINVLPTLVTNDLSMKYLDGSKFTAQTLDGQGNPLANQNVSFNINGVLYHRVTDKDGMASLNIRLMSGDYIITSYWNDFQVGNTVKIA